MAIIINIEDYRRKKALKAQEEAIISRIIKMLDDNWESEEEKIQYYLEQADKDGEILEELYPIPDDIAE